MSAVVQAELVGIETGQIKAPPRFGEYQLIRKLARGGMAEIYVARSMRACRSLCVLKRISPEKVGNPRTIEMFLQEVAITRSLDHPNLARVFDVGIAEGEHYFALEFLRGVDAKQLLLKLARKQRTLPLEAAVAIILGAAAGLHYAHEATDANGNPLKIVHRDISPHNIVVTHRGVPTLIDFGIAKTAASDYRTRPGALKGKARYMSPEQCKSADIDRLSDVFSLSIVLWELTTGTRLYEGSSPVEVMRKIVHTDARRPSEVFPAYPAILERIVMKGLEREPEKRYQTVAELAADLRDFARRCALNVSRSSLARLMTEVFDGEDGIDQLGSELEKRQKAGPLWSESASGCVESSVELVESNPPVDPFPADSRAVQESCNDTSGELLPVRSEPPCKTLSARHLGQLLGHLAIWSALVILVAWVTLRPDSTGVHHVKTTPFRSATGRTKTVLKPAPPTTTAASIAVPAPAVPAPEVPAATSPSRNQAALASVPRSNKKSARAKAKRRAAKKRKNRRRAKARTQRRIAAKRKR